MTNIVILQPPLTDKTAKPQPGQDGTNIIPFRKVTDERGAAIPGDQAIDERPDTPVENIILASATSNPLNRKDCEAALRLLIIQCHQRKLKVMQDDVRVVSEKNIEPMLYALVYCIKGATKDVLEVEVLLNEIGALPGQATP